MSSSESKIKTEDQGMDGLEQLIDHLKSFANPLRTFLEAKIDVGKVAAVRRATKDTPTTTIPHPAPGGVPQTPKRKENMERSEPPKVPRLSVSPLRPSPSTTRSDDWIKALHGQDDALLAELVESEPPGEALFELETYINGLYRGYDISAGFARLGFSMKTQQQAKEEKHSKAMRVVPIVESIRNKLGWDIREFDLRLLRMIRKSSALSLVLGAGVSCADPCGAPSWAALVKEVLQITLDRGLERSVPRQEDVEKVPGHVVQESKGSGVLPPNLEASGTTAVNSSSSPNMQSETPRTWTVRFEQKKVKEYADAEKQQARDIISKIDSGEADTEVLKNGADLAHSLCKQHLFTLITGILYRDGREPSDVHRAIALLAHPQDVRDRPLNGPYSGWNAIITYNFDSFMSRALAEEGVPSVAWAMRGADMAGDPNGLARSLGQEFMGTQQVLHLHGYTPPRLFLITNVRFVFATSQYTETYAQERPAIFRKFVEEYLENPIHVSLYVGCSFDDPDMNGLLERAIDLSPGGYHYALLKWPRDRRGAAPGAEELRAEQERYLRMGVRPIWFDEFAEIPHLIARLE
ncbi:hypothetical protein BFJ68_g17207 [Fusarium oxysporum]|uniref:Uncharacterized protein n=1 Tax=Fusarium oxysporum TaxID=5507 RepID=A0A420P033_FUSOX|nr:hypothetical protein BFJ68_g17207 [Fusarium oxysporum]